MKLRNIEKIKVVLDSNIIVSSAICDDGNPAKVFELLIQERIINYTSNEIIEEISGVFQREKIKKLINLEKSKFIVNAFKEKSVLIKPKSKIDLIKVDIDDNKVLECAIDSNAGFIITGDEHLLKIKNYKKIAIIPPKKFLDFF